MICGKELGINKKLRATEVPHQKLHGSELLEVLARAIHEDYLRSRQDDDPGSEGPSLVPWDELPETFRRSNREQAKDIEEKLRAIGCEIVLNNHGRPAVSEFAADEVEDLAKAEHDRWMSERIADGWTYGPVKNASTRQTPYLVPWGDLTEEIRELDRDTVRRIPRILARVDLVAVRMAGPS